MESVGTMSEGEWSSFNGTSIEEADFMAELLGNYPFSSEEYGVPNVGVQSTFWPSHEANTIMNMGGSESSYYCSDTFISNVHHFPQGSGYSSDSSLYFPVSDHQGYYLNESNPISMTNNSISMDYCMGGEQNNKTITDNVMEEAIGMNEEVSNGSMGASDGTQMEQLVIADQKLQHIKKTETPELPAGSEEKVNTNLSESSKKKKNSRGPEVQRKQNNTPSKKKQKVASASNDEEETTAGLNGQSSSNYSSEDDSNASQELNGGTTSCSKGSRSLNTSGKARASRGSATDPQSLYARKRRERINERLRILQNLVPNGTKVDISTMLEEAVEYVKFLQLQIKLLSSDEMWMYAPIAYNGMNIGLNLNISPPQ